MKQRTGIFSGTFDPIHQGHVAFALETMQACELNEIVFLPERNPRNKYNVTDISHRVAMIERATEDITGLHVLDLASEQFTVKYTLPELRRLFSNTHLTFLIGSDVVRTSLHRWEGLDTLLGEASLAVGMRTGDDPSQIAAVISELEKKYNMRIQYRCIDTQAADMTSSQIRNDAADMSLLHPAMLDYIKQHNLYAQSPA